MNKYSELIREKYAQIGSNDLGYIDDALGAVMTVLNEIVDNQQVPTELREKAAYAAANLLISDFDVK
ncbi:MULTISPECIES: YaeP family protein [unclassified Gilliamella]|uniref:YaeP family protein n=1 Tax=unclassified Gilliamella TaxID=2685620 RepID=UPI000ACD5466|nr:MULTISPECIES: YaeP family protein [unclassified Gilliamella]MBI0006499.1 YaeP family protein [Gilliamella sp. W8126]MBI0036825.1 YaeP family protein [Gilliamella sp. B14384G10]MBI0039521.1 YaeP family protein [Gilliamella sp. B14384G7]MBI0050820.1 YaeP family protein [Gilliamella sp. B14384G13]MBI0053112.1 YaeP family protein [Gilliamella sp. B14384H2]